MTRLTRSFLALGSAAVVALGLLPTVASAVAVAESSGSTGLVNGWRIQSSAVATGTGAEISRPGYSTVGWLPISQPETLMAGLLENGRYPNVFFGENLKSVDASQFNVNWWYRDELQVHPRPGRHSFLVM